MNVNSYFSLALLLKSKEAMLKIGYSINEITNINDLLQLILNEVINCIDDRSYGSVLLLDEEENLKIAVAKGYSSEDIKTFSRGLINLAGDSDFIGRFGGDEFVGVFSNIDFQILINRFESLIEHFKNNPIIFEENKIVCSFSYGISSFPGDRVEADELIKIADERMYKYKRIIKSKITK